ncbi:MAG: c-type cytochrome [Planctomycetota bacterium]|jgi:mono/diheme cytochrome c family protein
MTDDHHLPRKRTLAAVTGVVMAALLPIVACQRESRTAPLSSTVSPGSRGHDLFQAHCAACHGPEGRGDGIAATFLDVAPRDFWNEPFRYVSTLDGTATEHDLTQTIGLGRLPGQMPAAPWLSDDELAVLGDYVRELNRLGWAGRLTREFEGEDMSAREINEISTDRVAAGEAVSFAMPGSGFRPDLNVGRDLYLESCASCHGPLGKGDGLDMPLDELGRPIKVRDLTGEPIHGGPDPIELFKRIRCGVPGTPMPAQGALTDEQVWQLVYYTRFLMGRPLGRQGS